MTEAEVELLRRFLERNDLKGGLAYLLALSVQTPGRAPVLYHVGHVYGLMKDFGKAAQFYADAIRLEPTVATFHLGLGQVFQQQGDYESAARALKSAIDLQPDYTNAWNSLGLTYAMSGDLAAALAAYGRAQESLVKAASDRAKAEQPEVIETRFTDAGEKGLVMTDQYFVAVRRNLRSDLMYATVMNNIGGCYLSLDRKSEARAAFLESIEFIPDGTEYEPPLQGLRLLERNTT